MALFLLFFRRNSIFHIRFFLSRLLYLTLVNLKQSSVCVSILFLLIHFFCAKKTKKKFYSKVASHYVHRLSASYRKNVRTSQKMLGVHR